MSLTRSEERAVRKADAKNRTLRTFLQGLAIDIAVALSVLVLTGLAEVNSTTALVAFLISAGKTVVQSAAAYVMRMFVDTKTRLVRPPAAPGG